MASKKNMLSALVLGGGGVLLTLLLAFIIAFREGFNKLKIGTQPKVVATQATGKGVTVKSP